MVAVKLPQRFQPPSQKQTPHRHGRHWKEFLWGHNVQEHLFTNSKSDQWSTCFLPDTQLPCYNINVKVHIYGQVYVQATLTNHSLLIKCLRYNTYQWELEPIVIWYMTSYEINKTPKMHHITFHYNCTIYYVIFDRIMSSWSLIHIFF